MGICLKFYQPVLVKWLKNHKDYCSTTEIPNHFAHILLDNAIALYFLFTIQQMCMLLFTQVVALASTALGKLKHTYKTVFQKEKCLWDMKKTDSLNYLFIRLPSGLGNIFCSVIWTIIIFIICIIILSLAVKSFMIYNHFLL